MNKTHQAIMRKIQRLRIEEEGQTRMQNPSSSNLVLPKELPSVEEALKILCGALHVLYQGGLDQAEILRFRTIIQATKIYKELLTDYINYRGIEAKIVKNFNSILVRFQRWLMGISVQLLYFQFPLLGFFL